MKHEEETDPPPPPEPTHPGYSLFDVAELQGWPHSRIGTTTTEGIHHHHTGDRYAVRTVYTHMCVCRVRLKNEIYSVVYDDVWNNNNNENEDD